MLICSITKCNVEGFIKQLKNIVKCFQSPQFEAGFNVQLSKLQISLFNNSSVSCGNRHTALNSLSLPGYLSKVLRNYTEKACDGDLLSVRCPTRTTITIQSAFYGRKGASDTQRCPKALLSSYNAREDERYCSVSTALQVSKLKYTVYMHM